MTTEQDQDFINRFLQASISSDPAAFKEMMAPDFVAHVAGGPKNRDGFVQHMNVFNIAFSDMQVTVQDVVSDGEKVVARTTWRGTQDGVFMGVPPTGRQMEIEAYIVERLEEGKSVEHWSLFDQLTMMRQLGLLPTPA